MVIEGVCVSPLNENKTETVIIKEMQQDPIKEDILHIDFNHISLTEMNQ